VYIDQGGNLTVAAVREYLKDYFDKGGPDEKPIRDVIVDQRDRFNKLFPPDLDLDEGVVQELRVFRLAIDNVIGDRA
jgi:hypothetical protein